LKQAGSAFIADDHLLPHLTIPADVPPMDISHQLLSACLSAPQTELQAPATHWWWADSNLALLPPHTQEFKRFPFAVGQGYAAMRMALAMFNCSCYCSD